MRSALDEMVVMGVETNLDFQYQIIDAEDREHLHAGQQPPYAGDHRRPVLRHRRKTQFGGTDRQGTRGAVEIFQRGPPAPQVTFQLMRFNGFSARIDIIKSDVDIAFCRLYPPAPEF